MRRVTGSWSEDKEREYQVARQAGISGEGVMGVTLAKTFKKSFGRERKGRTMDGPEEGERRND